MIDLLSLSRGGSVALLVVMLVIVAAQIGLVVWLAVLHFKSRKPVAATSANETEAAPSQPKTGKGRNPALIASVKAVAILVCICFVCVALLAVCNELMYISDEERFNRSLSKIYPGFQGDSSFDQTPDSQFATNSAYKGQVKKVYKSTTGDYIIEALGGGGFQDGSVTLYVVVGADAKIKAWAVKENVGQSYIDRIPSNAGTTWYVGEDISNELALNMTGATVVATSTAINNAVNMASYYARNALGLGENPEADAQKAVAELLGDQYADYKMTSVNISRATVDGSKGVAEALSDANNGLSYLFLMQGEANMFAYVYGAKETLKIVVVKDNAIVAKTEGVSDTDEFVVNILANPVYTFTFGSYQAYAIVTESADGVYTVAGLKVGVTPNTYVLKITVQPDTDGKGKVSAIVATVNGYVPGEPAETNTNKLITSLVGARLDNIDAWYNDKTEGGTGFVTGATQSANLIRAAVQAALTAFDASSASGN